LAALTAVREPEESAVEAGKAAIEAGKAAVEARRPRNANAAGARVALHAVFCDRAQGGAATRRWLARGIRVAGRERKATNVAARAVGGTPASHGGARALARGHARLGSPCRVAADVTGDVARRPVAGDGPEAPAIRAAVCEAGVDSGIWTCAGVDSGIWACAGVDSGIWACAGVDSGIGARAGVGARLGAAVPAGLGGVAAIYLGVRWSWDALMRIFPVMTRLMSSRSPTNVASIGGVVPVPGIALYREASGSPDVMTTGASRRRWLARSASSDHGPGPTTSRKIEVRIWA